jgi:hypothetical protein
MYFNGNDAVTLEKNTGEIIDVFGVIGPPMTKDDNGWGNLNDTTITYNSGGVPTEYNIQNYIVGPLFWLSWTKDNTLLRKPNIGEGITANPDPYFVVQAEWDSLPKNTFDSLGFHDCYCNTLSIGENSVNVKVTIYPNPVINNEFSVQAEEPIEEIEIFDITGKLVGNKKFDSRMENVKVKFDLNRNGFYLVKIKLSSGQVQTKKLLFK